MHVNIMYKILPKTKKSAFRSVKTLLVSGGNEKESCHNKELHGYKSIKGAEETGMDTDDFTHVDQRRFVSGLTIVSPDTNFMGNSLEDSKPLVQFGIFNGMILSILHKYNKKVIVKIHDENSFFVKNI